MERPALGYHGLRFYKQLEYGMMGARFHGFGPDS
jgi:hypothetical protein